MSYLDDLAALGATEAELADLLDVLADVDSGGLDADGQAAGLGSLNQITSHLDTMAAREVARQDEDTWELPRNSEQRMAQLMGRAERGTYLPDPVTRPDFDPIPTQCGSGRDEFGRCRAPAHVGECIETARGEIIASTPEAMDAWRAALLPTGRSQATLMRHDAAQRPAGTAPNDTATYAAMRGLLGIGNQR